MTKLADNLYKATMSSLGSDEHLQIAGLLRGAKKIVLEDDSALVLRSLLDNDPSYIEANLDCIDRPLQPIWFEWNYPTRAGHGSGDDTKTGCLISEHPFDENLILCITGWQTNTIDARHAFSVALFDTKSLTQIAHNFRAFPNKAGSMDRIMNGVASTLPPGFTDELDILTSGDLTVKESTYRDATAEIPFLFSIMIALKCIGGLKLTEDADFFTAKIDVPLKRSWMERLLKRVRPTHFHIAHRGIFKKRPYFYR